IQMATLNGAEYFNLRHELGSIAPGRLADILFVESLEDFRPHRVLADGLEVGELPAYTYPPDAFESIRLARPLTEEDLRIPAIAGLMSDRPVAEVAEQVLALEDAYRQLGSPVENPSMIFSFLSLGVIPALRLTNRGLVDGVTFELLSPLA